jgi:hypothetical protein
VGEIARGVALMRIAVLDAGDSFAREYFERFVFANGHRTDLYEFVQNPPGGKFDAVVVQQSTRPLNRRYDIVCPPTRTLCALLEPPDVITLPDEYTRQFHTVVGPDARVICKSPLLYAAGHHWFVELTALEALEAPITGKRRLVSAVVSSKKDTPGHRARWRLMTALKMHFGDQLDWFGRGVRPTGDNKLSALADYKYHLVFENGSWPHYWTEKLSDAYMANCFPCYWGAPNINDYFDERSYIPIDPDRPDDAVKAIEGVIREQLWERRQEQLAIARKKIVSDYHPYNLWHSILSRLPLSDPAPVSIRPFNECQFGFRQRVRFRVRSALSRVSS